MPLTKRSLLTYLARAGEAGAKDVASAFAVGYSVAAMGLLRLMRQGLASRKADRGIYRYRLSERGQLRLDYLGDPRADSGKSRRKHIEATPGDPHKSATGE